MVNGVWNEDPYKIKDEMMRYYLKIFSGIRQDKPKFGSDRVNKLSEDEARGLKNMFSEKEIREAVMACGCDKAPSPYGFNFRFLKRLWEIIKTGVIRAVSDPIGLGDFRPISLIGTYYKIIAKMLAERLKHVAYNSLDWEYLLEIMRLMGFGDKWCKWIEIYAMNLMCILIGFEKAARLKVNLNKSRVYGIGVNREAVEDMARWMRCSVGELPITYLGLPIGNLKKVRRDCFLGGVGENKTMAWIKWDHVISSYGIIGVKYWVVKSIYGYEGVAGENLRAGKGGRGVWLDIMWVGSDIDTLGIEFSSSFVRKVGDGAHISFWRDRWIDGGRLMDRFYRLFLLDRHKDGVVVDKGNWVEGIWRWVWDWTRAPRGRVIGELEALEACVGNTNILLNHKDSWKWLLADNGIFSVKALTKLIEEKCIDVENNIVETIWNKLVPKKVNIFMWRVG
uniref:RNA-directed DNA polymerase, eukaryota, reverse transcriptase zinc-binding domain protein n=1 Tax=Tanacetum cinerariifolium TaxID=118510 RepID=A0A699JDB7_TANCI|nr:RNA-directed DNA polymerase, eukaryota, reverse transcriptase zinc-binding domain protein [Tanacetum cinerariifolium]